jgi:hypothetical protein
MFAPFLLLLTAVGPQGSPPIDEYDQLGMTPALCARLFPKNARQRIACAKPPYVPPAQLAATRACVAMRDAARKAGFEPVGKVTLRNGKVPSTCEFIPPDPK